MIEWFLSLNEPNQVILALAITGLVAFGAWLLLKD
jgi:hypothetical protein